LLWTSHEESSDDAATTLVFCPDAIRKKPGAGGAMIDFDAVYEVLINPRSRRRA